MRWERWAKEVVITDGGIAEGLLEAGSRTGQEGVIQLRSCNRLGMRWPPMMYSTLPLFRRFILSP